MNPRFSIILLLIALCIVGLSSCITIIDSGSMLDDVGRQSPVHPLKAVQHKEPTPHVTYEKEELQVWKKGSMYYVQLPITYIPTRIKNGDFLAGMSMYMSCKVMTYPSVVYRSEDFFLHQGAKEYFYAALSEHQFRKASTPHTTYADSFALEKYPVLPSAKVDLSGARKYTLTTEQAGLLMDNSFYIRKQLPDRRTTGNQWRRPLAFMLDIVDIPLSIIITPVAWGADFTHSIFSD